MKRTGLHANGKRALLLSLGGVALASATAGEVEYTMSRSSFRAGANRSQSDGFELSSTIGQPGTSAMTRGAFEMTGGFQIANVPTDCDEDGSSSLSDYSVFLSCMAGPNGSVSPVCSCYDVDASGSVDLRDFAEAQTYFGGP